MSLCDRKRKRTTLLGERAKGTFPCCYTLLAVAFFKRSGHKKIAACLLKQMDELLLVGGHAASSTSNSAKKRSPLSFFAIKIARSSTTLSATVTIVSRKSKLFTGLFPFLHDKQKKIKRLFSFK